MDDRFPETVEDEELELLLKELKLSGEGPIWEAVPSRPEDRVLRTRDLDARLYRRENGVWVKKPRESLGLMLSEVIRETMMRPSPMRKLMDALEVEPVVEMEDLLEDKK